MSKATRQKRARMKPPPIAYRKLPPEFRPEYFPTEYFREGSSFVAVGPTWEFCPNTSMDSIREEYRKRPDDVARDYGCRPSMTSGEKFCRNPLLVTERCNHERKSPLMEDGGYYEWFRPGDHEYVASYDLALRRDAAGFCLAHWDMETERVVVDVMQRFVPEDGGELSFDMLRHLTYDLFERGFYIAMVTADTWQSEETRQEFESRGYNFKFISVDRTPAAYQTLLDLLIDDMLDFYYDPVFDDEFSSLVRVGQKIDHPRDGHKDLSDAVAAACHVVREMYSTSPMVGPWRVGEASEEEKAESP